MNDRNRTDNSLMTATRRILTAGLPAVGLTVFAALAFAGSPAVAVEDRAVRPAVTATPCDPDTRGGCGYGATAATTGPTTKPTTPAGTLPTRGHTGYPTPTASVDTVPATTPPAIKGTPSPTTPGGVSAGQLPVTGAPTGAIISLGAVLMAGGAASIYYTRRRRNA
jgi:LPXTG-motif cell wall-anchored protein